MPIDFGDFRGKAEDSFLLQKYKRKRDLENKRSDYSRQFFASMFELSRKRQMEILQLSETCQED